MRKQRCKLLHAGQALPLAPIACAGAVFGAPPPAEKATTLSCVKLCGPEKVPVFVHERQAEASSHVRKSVDVAEAGFVAKSVVSWSSSPVRCKG